MTQSSNDTLASSRVALAQGEYFSAYELALAGLAETPNDSRLQHAAVLALARMGCTNQAQKLYSDYKLATTIEVDALALGARLEKDQALAQPASERAVYFIKAAAAYERVFAEFGRQDYYPAINAASLYHLAGESKQARSLAEETVTLCQSAQTDYWSLASLAEAQLVLGDEAACRTALLLATAESGADIANVAATRKQFILLKAPTALLDLLPLPAVAHFAGHIIGAPGTASRFPAEQEARVQREITLLLERHDLRIGYGSLAAGADILFAEAILARGGEINIVLPFEKQDFIEASVLSAGADWLQRFNRCLDRATSITYSSSGGYDGNNALFHNCSLYAMGLACLRQSHLGAPLMQVLVWDGEATGNASGTAGDRATWVRLGYPSRVISVRSTRPQSTAHTATTPEVQQSELTAVVFGDVAGFSKLSEREIPLFVTHVMGALAQGLTDALGDQREHLLSVNTWGDGIFMVFDNAELAAECAHKMLSALAGADLQSKGITEQPQLRLGANYGPVCKFNDPITGRLNFFGHQVNTAARIEPIAPTGEVYVTEAFAAQLALHPNGRFSADYVGEMQLAKDFGESRMYLLKQSIN